MRLRPPLNGFVQRVISTSHEPEASACATPAAWSATVVVLSERVIV
jgi:hypothetical protein